MKRTIYITLEGGVIQAIDNIPPDVEIVVADYDIDGSEHLHTDANGNEYVKSVWTGTYGEKQ